MLLNIQPKISVPQNSVTFSGVNGKQFCRRTDEVQLLAMSGESNILKPYNFLISIRNIIDRFKNNELSRLEAVNLIEKQLKK